MNLTVILSVSINSSVASYAGVKPVSDYNKNAIIEAKVDSLNAPSVVAVEYGSSGGIVIVVAPAENAVGKKLVFSSTNSEFIIPQFLTINSSGKAILEIKGDTRGETIITETLENTGLSNSINVVSGVGVEAYVGSKETASIKSISYNNGNVNVRVNYTHSEGTAPEMILAAYDSDRKLVNVEKQVFTNEKSDYVFIFSPTSNIKEFSAFLWAVMMQ